MQIENFLKQQVQSLDSFTRRYNQKETSFYDYLNLEIQPIYHLLQHIEKNFNISMTELIEIMNNSEYQNKKRNPYMNSTISVLKNDINHLFPYIFCQDWSFQKCASFLWKHENTPEYQLHPLYFKFYHLSLHELQTFTGKKHNNREEHLKDIVSHCDDVFPNNDSIIAEYYSMSLKVLQKKIKEKFPRFPGPTRKKDCIFILSTF